MSLALALVIVGGLIFWIFAGALGTLAVVSVIVGFFRAASMHRFLVTLRIAADGGFCPYRYWRSWPKAFLIDVAGLIGMPGSTHGRSLHFEGEGRNVIGSWRGFGDWEVNRSSPPEATTPGAPDA